MEMKKENMYKMKHVQDETATALEISNSSSTLTAIKSFNRSSYSHSANICEL
ncbi:hypothetical protein VULLAG_LOCUS3122 [Vulpes lagopus]